MKIFKKRVGFNLVFLLLLGIIISPTMVDAKKSSSSAACRQALFPSDDPIVFEYNNEKASVSINLGEGTWDLYYYIEKLDSNDDGDWSDVFKSNGKLDTNILKHTVYKAGEAVPSALSSITRTKKSKRIFVLLALRDDGNNHGVDVNGNTLKVGENNSTCKSGSYSDFHFNTDTWTFSLLNNKTLVASSNTIPGKLELATINKNDNPQCIAMKEGKYSTTSKKSYLEELGGAALDEYNQKMSKAFPYCYNGGSSYLSDISNSTIKKVRQSSLKAFKVYYEFNQQQKENSKEFETASTEISDEGYKWVDYKNKKATISTLTCDKKAVTETTKKYYTSQIKEVSNQCKVQCQEQLQVIYDPPTATKAGLCFQYKVTVKSKVTCKVVQSPTINWPTMPETCGYVPICSNDREETQAGPNDEFDSCINSCDGGKYTQSCINSCYKKVYESSNTSSSKKTTSKTTTNSNTTNIVKLSNNDDNDPYYNIKGCKSNEQIKNNITACAKEFYQLKQKYPAGYYERIGNTNRYNWIKCNGSNKKCKYVDEDDKTFYINVDAWKKEYKTSLATLVPSELIVEQVKRASPYYFRTEADAINLVQSFFGINQGLNGFGARRAYQIDDGGIKRQWTNSYSCYEKCNYIKDGSSTDTCATSSEEVGEELVKQFETIESDLEECTAAAACSSEKAVFIIDVTNDKNSDDETHTEKWKATNKTSDQESEVDNKGNGDYEMFIPLDSDKEPIEIVNGINGKCYARDNDDYWQHYKTTITFPGTWIDLKTGERKYAKPNSNDINGYKQKKNYFCVGFDSKNVNTAWWDWKINNKGSIDKITVEKDDNIKANIDNFGKYHWNLSINCFYGLYTGVTPPPDDTPSKDECNDENSTAFCNFKYRSVDQENMFPSGTVGFNWTSAATDQTLKDSGSSYYVDPGKYAQITQATANDAYSGTPDYEIYLTKENLKSLKSYATKKTYTNFAGTYPSKYIDKDGEGKAVPGFRAYEIDSQVTSMTSAFKRFTTIGVNNAGKTK